MERRFIPNELAEHRLEVREDTGPEKISGWGVVFYDGTPGTEFEIFPGVVERIMPDAEITHLRGDVISTFNHDPSALLGRKSSGSLTLRREKKGLRYTVTPPNTTTGRDVIELVRRGDLQGSSMAFTIPRGGEKWVSDGDLEVREVRHIELVEVGPVTEPAYAATTAGLRATGDVEEARRSLEAYRAEGEEDGLQAAEEREALKRRTATRARVVEVLSR